jgi:hypothetical protein
MSGIRHHFIPQFLQVGFASHSVGDESYTWVFRLASAPYNPNIRNSGLERRFYAENGDTTVDATITDAERAFSALVLRLKNNPAGPIVETELPHVIAHLEVRTRHLRESFLRGGTYLVDRLLSFMSDADAVAALIERRMANDPAWVRGLVAEEMMKRGVPAHNIGPALDAIMPSAEQLIPVFLARAKPHFASLATSMRSIMPRVLAEAAKTGHLRALKQTIHPDLRVAAYSPLHFRIEEVRGTNLILGDSAVLFALDGPRRFRPFTDKHDVVQGVLLPLTPTRILIGEREPTNWDYTLIKRQTARCSLEYFIAHENTVENQVLKDQIGADAAPLTQEQLDSLAFETFKNLEAPNIKGQNLT